MTVNGTNHIFDIQSESETLSVAGITRTRLEGYYWYGKKRFDSAVAWAVLHGNALETIAGLDSSSDNLIAEFDYRAQVNALRSGLQMSVSNIADDCASDRHAYLTIVGVVFARGEDADRALLSSTLNRAIASSSQASAVNQNVRPEPIFENNPPLTGSTTSASPPAADTVEETLRLRYAANSLYQHGQRAGFNPVYTDGTSNDPPGKRVTVTCNGVSYSAVARNKVLAKQLAAMNACRALEVQIEAGN